MSVFTSICTLTQFNIDACHTLQIFSPSQRWSPCQFQSTAIIILLPVLPNVLDMHIPAPSLTPVLLLSSRVAYSTFFYLIGSSYSYAVLIPFLLSTSLLPKSSPHANLFLSPLMTIPGTQFQLLGDSITLSFASHVNPIRKILEQTFKIYQ